MGVLLIGVGSGGTNILSRAYLEYETIRKEENCCYCINSSSRDYQRVEERFKEEGLPSNPENFQMRTVGAGIGAGKDADSGAEMYRKESSDLLNEFEDLHKRYDFVIGFSIGCLGGGFGTLSLAESTRDIRGRIDLPIIPLATLPRRGEGELLVKNARRGLNHLTQFGLPPILYDNERASAYSPTIGVAIRRANRVIGDTIAGLVNTVEYIGFAVPPIDIRDILKVVRNDCATFTGMRTDDVRVLRNWKNYLMKRNLSLDSKPIDQSKVFTVFQGPEFPREVADDVSKYLRTEFKASETITSCLEDEVFREYAITSVIYGMSKDEINPKLEPAKSLREKIFGKR